MERKYRMEGEIGRDRNKWKEKKNKNKDESKGKVETSRE